jgi:DNA recombination protein RmuC
MIEPVSLVLGVIVGSVLGLVGWLWSRQHTVATATRLAAERDAALRAVDEQRELLSHTRAEARDTFAALSREALKDNRADFMHTADALFAPVRDTLDKVRAQLADVDKAREGTFQSVTAQLRSLSTAQEQLRLTTEGLSRSLRSPNVRGKWGEIQLRRILELAGMLHHCDFAEKESGATSDGARRTPDLIVRLPGGTHIVVDSKVPFDAYLASCQATTDAQRQEHTVAHARQVRDHIRALGAKEYWRQFDPAPEFVVMFLPLEPLLSAAFEQDGSLLEQAAALRVIPATPMTLLALLKAIGYGWQQMDVAKNSEEIRTLGRELYERLGTMVEHLQTLGANIKQAAGSYDRFIGSLEQKVMPAARKFRELGVSTTRTIDTPDELDLTTRQIRSSDLLGPIPDPPAGRTRPQ